MVLLFEKDPDRLILMKYPLLSTRPWHRTPSTPCVQSGLLSSKVQRIVTSIVTSLQLFFRILRSSKGIVTFQLFELLPTPGRWLPFLLHTKLDRPILVPLFLLFSHQGQCFDLDILESQERH